MYITQSDIYLLALVNEINKYVYVIYHLTMILLFRNKLFNLE